MLSVLDLIKWFVLLVLWCCDAFIVIVLSDKPRQNQERGRQQKSLSPPPPPVIFAGVPRRLFLFWFFADLRCGVPLFIVILVIYKYKNR